MVDVLVIPDGAAQPPRDGAPTALERARTPVLDALAGEGVVMRVVTTPERLPAGSETGVSTLLGAPPSQPVGRGWVDAAAYGVEVPDGMTPWRADLVYSNGKRGSVRQARDICSHLGPGAYAVGGHRLLLLAGERPADRRMLGLQLRVWNDGPPPAGSIPATVVICAAGAAAGCGRLLGAEVVVPEGATGDVGTDLHAKASAAMRASAGRIVVHVGAPDEAAHRRDADGVVAALERLDAELLAPLREAVRAASGRLTVCPDHFTDPFNGRHGGAPVPAVVWGAGVSPAGPDRLTERAAATAPVASARELANVAAVAL